MTSIELLLCALLVCISGFLAASEIALFSLSRFQLRSIKERSLQLHRKVKRLLSDPSGLLVTILLLTELVNVSLSTLITQAVSREWGEGGPNWLSTIRARAIPWLPDWALQSLVGLLITAPLVLFLCEITPKAIAARANEFVAPFSVGPLTWIYDRFRWLRVGARHLVELIARLVPKRRRVRNGELEEGSGEIAHGGGAGEPLLREEEFLFMIEEGHKEGAIHESELELIRSVFALDDTTVADVYTPLSEVYALQAITTLPAAITTMRSRKFSRIPVFEGMRRNITGVLYSKDLLLARLEPDFATSSVGRLARRPYVVNLSLKLSTLFRRMKQHRLHFAVVEGKPGEAIGIVTMSDILDELFDEFIEPGEDAEDEVSLA